MMHLDEQAKIGHDALNFQTLAGIYLKSGRYSDGTKKLYARNLALFNRIIHCQPRSITYEHIEQLDIATKKTIRTPAAYNMFICVIHSFFSWLSKNGYCQNVSLILNKTPYVKKQRRKITQEEYDKVMTSKIPQYKKDVFSFLCHTGLRVEGFMGLTKNCIHGDFIYFVNKGGKIGVVPINKTIQKILNRDPQLSFIRGKHPNWLTWLCANIAQCVGIPKINPHACRHFLANSLHKKNVDLKKISLILNHVSTSVTEKVYIEWNREEEIKGVTDVLD